MNLSPSSAPPEAPIAPASTATAWPQFQVGHLERLPLGTTYPGVVSHVLRLLDKPPIRGNADLIIDFTGVGRPVFDMFVQRGLSPIGVTITAGDVITNDGLIYRVPKLILISRVQGLLHSGQLRIQKELPDASALTAELQEFRAEVTDSGYWRFGARSGKHDDLILALAIALWRAHGGVSEAGWLEYARVQLAATDKAPAPQRFMVGVDLGQSQDPTAIAIVRRVDKPEAPAQSTRISL